MPVDLNRLTEGWLELESDPGLFTLLLEDFGVKGVQVEEIYDLQKPIDGPVYGFIFLFKWIEERRARRKTAEEKFVDEDQLVNSIFFAHQVVPNSCATHALLSVLLNCTKVHLGPTLNHFKDHTKNMNPENKGHAIGNSPDLAKAHNSHAKPQPRYRLEKNHSISSGVRTKEAFHFVSYVPVNGQLYELDGLKPYPIDHGSVTDDWTDKFRSVIMDRLGSVDDASHDIRFNLMAVVPDRRHAFQKKLRTLKTNHQIVLESLQQLVRITHPQLTSADADTFLAAINSQNLKQSSSSSSPQSLPFGKLHAPLDYHNYAKNPLVEGWSRTTSYEEYSDDEDHSQPLEINTEFLKPLTIQTKFQHSPSTGSSTDTSSEIGSAFNSPVACHSSPEASKPVFKKEHDQILMENVKNANKLAAKISTTRRSEHPFLTKHDERMDEQKSPTTDEESTKQLIEPHQFAPKDLLALLKTVEAEIHSCEANLKDEVEKRKKYKVDDCRRTHNYDQFICTFLSMLAEQGKLSDLVEQQIFTQRQVIPRIKTKKPEKRKKTKAKRRK